MVGDDCIQNAPLADRLVAVGSGGWVVGWNGPEEGVDSMLSNALPAAVDAGAVPSEGRLAELVARPPFGDGGPCAIAETA